VALQGLKTRHIKIIYFWQNWRQFVFFFDNHKVTEVAQRIILKEKNLAKLCVLRGELKSGIWCGIANPTTHLPDEPVLFLNSF